MPSIENRPLRVALRARPDKKHPHVALRTPKPKPLSRTISSGNTARANSQHVENQTKPSDAGTINRRQVRAREQETPTTVSKSWRDKPPVYNGTNATDKENDYSIEKISSTLTSLNTSRKTQTPRSNKSPRWDPAIISCGPVTSGQEKKLRSSHFEPVFPTQNLLSSTLTEAVRTLLCLEKSEQEELFTLLQSIAGNESRPSNTSRRQQTKSELIPRPNSSEMKKLNPEAPAFRDFSGIKGRISQPKVRRDRDAPSDTFQKRAQVPVTGAAPQKDTNWLNIFTPPLSEGWLKDTSNLQATPRGIRTRNSSTLPVSFSQPILVPIPVYETPYGLQISSKQPIWFNTLGSQSYALPISQTPPVVQRLPTKPRRVRGPIVDISPEFIPPEEGSGRIAHAHAIDPRWGQSLLDKFTAKYPRTGNIIGPASAPGRMRQAAAIQQQLEFLLFQEKEKTAMGDCVGNTRRRNYQRGSGSEVSLSTNETLGTAELEKSLETEMCLGMKETLKENSPSVIIG